MNLLSASMQAAHRAEEEPDFAEDYEVDRSRVRVEFPSKLRGLFQPKRFKVMYGGRGGAKSWSVAMALLVMGSNRPLRILCCARARSRSPCGTRCTVCCPTRSRRWTSASSAAACRLAMHRTSAIRSRRSVRRLRFPCIC